jgi:hypothetical protein
MNLIIDHACGSIGFPMCKYVSTSIPTYASRAGYLFGLKICAPCTVALLVCSMVCIGKMINHVKCLCSAIGRKEMTLFFYIYFASTLLESILVGLKGLLRDHVHLFLTTLQLSLANLGFFALLAGSHTMDMFVGPFGMKTSSILYLVSLLYFIAASAFVYTALAIGNSIVIFIVSFFLSILFYLLYFVRQLKRLRKINGEIWAYGTMFIAFVCFVLAQAMIFAGADLIALSTDKYFDNLFFYHLFMLCSFVMIHKYWLSNFDYEVECLVLDV